MNTRMKGFRKERRIAFALTMSLLTLVGALALLGTWSGGPISARAAAATDVTGSITDVVTWTRGSSPYIVQDPGVTVETGGTLIIEPGVEVRFEPDTTLEVYGELVAVGTMTRPITFTSNAASPAPGDWWGIAIDYEGAGQLAWCDLAYAGGGALPAEESALDIYAPDVAVSHCHIHDNAGSGVAARGFAGLHLSDSRIEDNGGHGVVIDGGGSVLDPTIENVTIANNQGAAIRQGADLMIPTYRAITATGNLTDAVVIQAGTLSRGAHWDFAQAGLPVQIAGSISTGSDTSLSIGPGTALYFQPDTALEVWGGGSLYALGIAGAPITFTGAISQPGSWEGIGGESGHILLNYCDVSHGGANEKALVEIKDGDAIQNSRIHHSAGVGVEARGQPAIDYNQIYSNATYGLYSSNAITPVDARFNWWGHPSGPYHEDQNPEGKGDAVSDNVLFSPWLTDTSEGGGLPQARLTVDLGGPDWASPGEVGEYAISYKNFSTRTITSPLVLELPFYAQHLDHTGDGTHWPARHEVFWDEDLAPGESLIASTRVRYLWGAEEGTIDWAVSYPADILTPLLEAHLNYQPTGALTETTLSRMAFEDQCEAAPELEQLYQQFLDEGAVFAAASRRIFRDGDVITQATLLTPDPDAVTFLQFDGEDVSSVRMDPTRITIHDAQGGSVYDPELRDWTHFGGWVTETVASQSGSVGPQSVGSYAACWVNCARDKLIGLAASAAKLKAVDAVLSSLDCVSCVGGDPADCASCAAALKGVPGVGEVIDVTGLMWCSEECKEPEECYEDAIDCSHKIAQYWTCNRETGEYEFGKVENCVEDPWWPDRYICLPGEGCIDLQKEEPDWEDSLAYRIQGQTTRISSAHDPNAKYGEAGDLLPGQRVTYTIAYENEGEGMAYGVYVADELSEHFDPATLHVVGDGRYLSPTRTLLWTIGTVGSSGQVTATGAVTFSAQLKPDLPGGTVISNQAVVHFPSVPEETPTNSVVNVIQPVRARPQTVRTGVMQPISITLQGHEVGGTLLTARYTVTAEPRYGELTGDPPNLTYRPMDNFSGLDHFSFRVSNGVTASRPAEVSIIVEPGESDTIAPEVRWTDPLSGAVDVWASVVPVYSAHEGEPVYTPIVNVGFSEAMSASTVTSQTVQLLGSDGDPIPATVTYDEMGRQARLVPAESLPGSGFYSGRVLTGVRDASGNPLAEEYAWPLQVELEVQRVYLPLVLKGLGGPALYTFP